MLPPRRCIGARQAGCSKRHAPAPSKRKPPGSPRRPGSAIRRTSSSASGITAHCAGCHGAPGVPRGDIAQGLYPPPPDLAKAASLYTPAELFWIIKHGIKMTGLPAWSDHSDEEIWATVGFLEKLPGMKEQDYAGLVIASMAHSGHHSSNSDDTNPSHVHPKP